MSLLDNYLKSWQVKYAQPLEKEIRDTMILLDSFFLSHLGQLNQTTRDELAKVANVHPDHILKVIEQHNEENKKIVEEAAAKVKAEAEEVTDAEVIEPKVEEVPKEEALKIVTEAVQEKQNDINEVKNV